MAGQIQVRRLWQQATGGLFCLASGHEVAQCPLSSPFDASMCSEVLPPATVRALLPGPCTASKSSSGVVSLETARTCLCCPHLAHPIWCSTVLWSASCALLHRRTCSIPWAWSQLQCSSMYVAVDGIVGVWPRQCDRSICSIALSSCALWCLAG